MENTRVRVSVYEKTDGYEWLAVSEGEPRFALVDVSEKGLEQQVKRALLFYAKNKDEIERQVAIRQASYADWQASEQIPFSSFLQRDRKMASIDSTHKFVINGVS